MKKILITGANSYIGTSFEKYIKDTMEDEMTRRRKEHELHP